MAQKDRIGSVCAPLLAIILVYLLSVIVGIAESNFKQGGDHKYLNETGQNNLRNTIEKLEGYGERTSWKKQTEAIAWVEEQFQKLEMDTWIQTYEYDGKEWPNLCTRIEGNKEPSKLIMIIAHIDSISRNPNEAAPGADDNGTGVAVLLESARIIRDVQSNKTIQFCIFTNEDQNRKGSIAFARRAKREGQNIEAVINLDTLGYNRPGPGEYLHAFSAPSSFYSKGKAAYRMAQNTISRLSAGKNTVLVAGKPPNEKLVKIISQKIQEYSGISTKEVVGDDCG